MKKWEQEMSQKIHKKKIQNAKPTIKNPKCTIIEISDEEASEEGKDSYFYFALKKFSLQQYYKKLMEMKESSSSLLEKSSSEISIICEYLKILPGHRAKFNKLLEYLRNPETQYTRNNSICKEKPQTNSTKSTKERYTDSEDALALCSEKSIETDQENLKLKESFDLFNI